MSYEWIELSDGCRLSARIWLPDGAGPDHRAPAILEYLPYRKDDHTAWQDSTRHPYFAAQGFAAVRVDIRGTGDSDGILLDEYLAQEQDDAVEVIAWIAEQPWCSGAVGMIGYSWGGFNGLQIAARRPPALKAVVSMHSTDDRYSDDCHYLGGAVLANDMLRWAHTMRAIDALPPTPEVVGERWREVWLERLERTPHFVEAWLTHQTYDDFWKQGSIREDYSAIEAATFVVGGWTDAYTNAVPRMLEHLSCPKTGLIGPWAHIFPERGVPGPAIGFLQECVAWFERWLNERPTAADEWPLLRAWMQEPVEPAGFYAERPGRWLAVGEWPPNGASELRLGLTAAGELVPSEQRDRDSLADDVARPTPEALSLSPVQSCGEAACVWCSNGLPDELAGDQHTDDVRSLCFDSAPLAERLELLGRPELTLEIEATAPVGTVVARLCDIAPDGVSTLITYGVLNLTHRNGDESPEALVPGERYVVRVQLNVIGQAVDAGHRLRLALSPTWWPMVWPQPVDAPLVVVPGGSTLALPALARDAAASAADALVGFGPRARRHDPRTQPRPLGDRRHGSALGAVRVHPRLLDRSRVGAWPRRVLGRDARDSHDVPGLGALRGVRGREADPSPGTRLRDSQDARMKVRPHRPEEFADVLALIGEAFADELVVVDLVRDLVSDATFLPEFSLVADDDGELVGYVLLSRASVVAGRQAPTPVLALAPLGVRPARQRQGVGSALVAEALRRARERGERAVLVLGDPAYYGRFGFAPASPLGILPPHPIEYADAWMLTELIPGALESVSGTVRFDTPLGDPVYW